MKKKNIVTIGGGTGSFVLLSGLKKYPVNIAAIISMSDDGGSTGRLRDELGVLPPGDVRQCLVALSESSEEMRNLMNYRFENGGLEGHSFGNILLSALEKINGSFSRGVEEASRILSVTGEVIPVTEDDAKLCMELKNGKKLKGEHNITNNLSIEKIGVKKYCIFPKVKANPKAIEKIKRADVVIIGPGNHYSSVLPNLLVGGIPEAVLNSRAKVIYNCNMVNKKGQTEKFSLDDYVEAVNMILGGERINCVTYSTSKPSGKLLNKYNRKGEVLVEFSKNSRKKRSYEIVKANLLNYTVPIYSKNDAIASTRSFIRHDSDKLAKVLMKIIKDK
ncbi:MAG: YvcK family protein [Candidatus Moranbacteria bacterium]|nr:YvcK family protein [Candidatus Moranbacteria bacterium]